MVISISPTAGIRCQVGDFSVIVDPSTKRTPTAKGGRQAETAKKGQLTLFTKATAPLSALGSPDIIQGPGEYEMFGIRVRGVALTAPDSKTLHTAYAAEFDDIHLAFLADIQGVPSEQVLDRLGAVDILFLSADERAVASKQAVSLIKQIDPSITIPLTDAVAKKIAEEMGQKLKAEDKLVTKKKDIEKEDSAHKLIWLKTV